MMKLERAVRGLDGVIVGVAVVLVVLWVSGERGSDRRYASGPVQDVARSMDFTQLPGSTTARPVLVRRGTRIALPDVEWHAGTRNIILLASATCSACNDSITFYRSLGKYALDVSGLRFVIVAADDVDAVRNWADTHAIQYDVLVGLRNAISFGFSLTPTLLLVNDKGVATDVLLRRLSGREESLLWERLRRPDSASPLSNVRYTAEIDDAEFKDLIITHGDRVVVVDVRSRSHYRGSRTGAAVMNIPLNELAIRGPVELGGRPGRGPVVVDCTAIHWIECRWAGSILESRGVGNVSLLLP